MIPKKKPWYYIKPVIIVTVIIVIPTVIIFAFMLLKNQKVNANMSKKTLLESLTENTSEASETFEEESTEVITEIYTEEEEVDDDVYATSHEHEPVTQDIVKISDMYAVKGEQLTLKSYYPDATGYVWELYNTDTKDWEILDAKTVYDELYRPVSTISLDLNQDIMVRCSVEKDDPEEKILDIASVKCVKSIINIAVADEKFETGSGWLLSRDIPVKVTYRDNTSEILSGLYGLVFVDSLESSEITYSDTGNMIETVTIVNTECEYSYVDTGKKDFVIRYRERDKSYDANLTVVSTDTDPPIISNVSLSDFSIRNVDEPVTIEVTISAEDNDTLYPELEYAFLPEGVDPEDTDWITKPKFERDIDKNGIWVAYCRDKCGNIAKHEKKIIAVDQKAPELILTLEKENWCASNKIIANAKDELTVTYLFTCYETGENSGWIEENEYDVTQNGTWEVQAKDAVGNISVKDITISNIDVQMPIIKGITEGEQLYED